MKKFIILSLAGVAALASCKGTETTSAPSFDALSNENDSLSYFLGTEVAGSFIQSKIDKAFEPTAFVKGLQDGFSEAEYLVEVKDIEPQLRTKFMALYQDTTASVYIGKASGTFESLKNIDDTLNYYIGTDVSSRLAKNGFKDIFSENAYLQGIHDAMSKLPFKVNSDAMNLRAKEIVDAKGKIFAKVGEDFLITKTAEEGVITLPSGLRYKILSEGTGAKPQATDRVKAHYHGTLIDGTVFDSSVDRGEPLEIGVNQVIPGWTEALQLMPVGSKWELYIPFNLAYGPQGSQAIPPYSALVFQVELLEVLPAAPQMAPQMPQGAK